MTLCKVCFGLFFFFHSLHLSINNDIIMDFESVLNNFMQCHFLQLFSSDLC